MQTPEHCLAMAEACERRFRYTRDQDIRRFLRCLREFVGQAGQSSDDRRGRVGCDCDAPTRMKPASSAAPTQRARPTHHLPRSGPKR